MTLAFSVLGSGSRGNCTLLRTGEGPTARAHLIDCGLSPRRTTALLAAHGIALERVESILLTHLDTDHCHAGWVACARRHDTTIHVAARHRARALRTGFDGRSLHLHDGPFEPAPGTRVEPVALAHDQLGTVGFVIEHDGRRLGFATDLGRVTSSLLDRFTALDALAIESNYDPALERSADRPDFVKRRVTGGLGHLSNEQSIEAVAHIDASSTLAHVVPLHLSQQCNAPDLVRRLYAERLPHLAERLTLSSQKEPTPLLRVEAASGERCAASGARRGATDAPSFVSRWW